MYIRIQDPLQPRIKTYTTALNPASSEVRLPTNQRLKNSIQLAIVRRDTRVLAKILFKVKHASPHCSSILAAK
jgi:hypothetical protein